MAMTAHIGARKGFGESGGACYERPAWRARAVPGILCCGLGSGKAAFLRGDRRQVQVLVRDNNVDQALKALKKKLQREGVFREMKLRRHYEKPSERRAREAAEAVRRARKMERKRLEREGF
jgi:small subunit ribosomal protein S21